MNAHPHFDRIDLDADHHVLCGTLPVHLMPDGARFEGLWDLHPAGRQTIHVHGRPVVLPRWQQAYGADYRFSGQTSRAIPVPTLLAPYLEWSRATLDPRMNSLLLNWYDGAHKHYIGRHRDSDIDRVVGSFIVTISLGGERVFRMRRWRQTERRDLPIPAGSVVVIPWRTNRAWTHEVPHFARYTDRRVSITVRAFDRGVLRAPAAAR